MYRSVKMLKHKCFSEHKKIMVWLLALQNYWKLNSTSQGTKEFRLVYIAQKKLRGVW
jgi:hypothetical protein